jgi:hypothetical protein
LFSPPVTASLYGARLGVGPLTILPTWLWWAAAVLAASAGPAVGALVGAVFGATRMAVVATAATRLNRPAVATAAASARLRTREAIARPAIALVTAGACALALGVSGCSSPDAKQSASRPPRPKADSSSAAPSSPPRAQTATSQVPPATTTVPPLAITGLGTLLVDRVPAGFAPADPRRYSVGPLDLRAVARSEPDPAAEQALLETRHFRSGWSRMWTDATGRVLGAVVYEFAAPDGAAAYLTDGILRVDSHGGEEFPVPAVSGARGFSQIDERNGKATVTHAVAFVRANRFFLVFAGSSGPGVTPDDARALAAAQAGRVPPP